MLVSREDFSCGDPGELSEAGSVNGQDGGKSESSGCGDPVASTRDLDDAVGSEEAELASAAAERRLYVFWGI